MVVVVIVFVVESVVVGNVLGDSFVVGEWVFDFFGYVGWCWLLVECEWC